MMAVMLRGRHRGLPLAVSPVLAHPSREDRNNAYQQIDRSVMLPKDINELEEAALEDEMQAEAR